MNSERQGQDSGDGGSGGGTGSGGGRPSQSSYYEPATSGKVYLFLCAAFVICEGGLAVLVIATWVVVIVQQSLLNWVCFSL